MIVYPGLAAGAWSTRRLRGKLIGAGFAARDWGFGLNHGPRGSVEAWLSQLRDAVALIHDEYGRKVSLVGWSLGGIYAREVARLAPELVRQVVTLGTPFAARPEDTHASWLYGVLNRSKPPTSKELAGLKQALPVPSTSVYSKADGVVPWRGCIQMRAPLAENIEVSSASHLGMGVNRDVLRLIAERLAQPEGAWRPYGRPSTDRPFDAASMGPEIAFKARRMSAPPFNASMRLG